MKNNKIGLIGYLGYATDDPIIGGQMSKTRGIEDQLKKRYEKVMTIDTSNWKAEKIKLVCQCIKMAFTCKTVIIMPNKNGIKFVLPFFSSLKKIFKYKLAYPVVGGWLTSLLEKHGTLSKGIKKVDYILPETVELQNELRRFYDGRIDVMPIFSTREPLTVEQLPEGYDEPYSFCTFSRVTPEKGIDDAIEAVSIANRQAGRNICRLDVWGPIESGFEEHYQKLFEEHAAYVEYKGVLGGDQGLDHLASYYMMLFPTYYPGEGFPTTVCESFMCGLPVIASDWRFNKELVQDDETGHLFPVHNIEKLAEKISFVTENKEAICKMHLNCLEKSKEFKPEAVMENLNNWIDSER